MTSAREMRQRALLRLDEWLARWRQARRPAVGDVVQLRSGGRRMTVTYAGPVIFAPGRWLICQWFDEAGECAQEMFPEAAVAGATSPRRQPTPDTACGNTPFRRPS
jgi:uncharacterized protein YodC (DUF2158 family)